MKTPKKLLLQEDSFCIYSQTNISQEVIDFLNSIKWGNEGAVYEHKNTEEQIRELHNPSLLSVEENGVIVATAVFCHYQILVNSKAHNCHYIRYFASSPQIRGRGLMKYFGKTVMELIKEHETEKSVFLGFVESGNISSYKVVKSAGYTQIGTVKTVGFSRFFPCKSKEISRVKTAEEQQEVISLLKKQYKKYALVQFNSLFINDDYFVIRKNGEIVAGCQMHKAHWVVKNMGGISGKIIMNVVPYVPIINKMFNPKKFEFLAFEGIICKNGYEETLHELFNGLLAQNELKSALMWFGENCEMNKRLNTFGKLGLLNKFTGNAQVNILADFKDMSKTEKNSFKAFPIYASAFDYI